MPKSACNLGRVPNLMPRPRLKGAQLYKHNQVSMGTRPHSTNQLANAAILHRKQGTIYKPDSNVYTGKDLESTDATRMCRCERMSDRGAFVYLHDNKILV